jgi:hypothetical protein
MAGHTAHHLRFLLEVPLLLPPPPPQTSACHIPACYRRVHTSAVVRRILLLVQWPPHLHLPQALLLLMRSIVRPRSIAATGHAITNAISYTLHKVLSWTDDCRSQNVTWSCPR